MVVVCRGGKYLGCQIEEGTACAFCSWGWAVGSRLDSRHGSELQWAGASSADYSTWGRGGRCDGGVAADGYGSMCSVRGF